ncbi:uncharacterized protein [Rutidosis leptorrhynchoides]|uniref:uncharacterized protein n=1 Tax=Rutidosis leptorrhynchoides TaxID=125765 RepID=UPI003A98D471
MSSHNEADQIWTFLAYTIREAAKEALGVAVGTLRGHRSDRESWWLSDEVQSKVALKQLRFRELITCREGTPAGRTRVEERYKEAKREAKKAVARAKDKAYEDVYRKLDSKEGANDIYRIAKARERRRRDLDNIKFIKNEAGKTLVKEEYFASLFSGGRPECLEDPQDSDIEQSQNNIDCGRINQEEVRSELRKMGRNKAAGLDQIPVEVWRCLGDDGIRWLTCLFNKTYQSSKMPMEWRVSEIIPIYKNKGDAQTCGRSSIEANHIIRNLMEKYREKQKNLEMDFIDLEKAYDCWEIPKFSQLKLACIRDRPLALFLFALILDELSRGIQERIPWCLIFADDIVLVSESKEELNRRLEQWRVALEGNGLKISRQKTEYLRCDFDRNNDDQDDGGSICIGDQILHPQTSFRYLGSMLHKSGRIDEDVSHRIKVGWVKWRAATGVLCDRKIPLKLKGKFFKVRMFLGMYVYGCFCVLICLLGGYRYGRDIGMLYGSAFVYLYCSISLFALGPAQQYKPEVPLKAISLPVE